MFVDRLPADCFSQSNKIIAVRSVEILGLIRKQESIAT